MTATERTPITEAERQRRAKQVWSLRRSQMIDGGDISPFAISVYDEYIAGQISMKEAGERIRAHYGVK